MTPIVAKVVPHPESSTPHRDTSGADMARTLIQGMPPLLRAATVLAIHTEQWPDEAMRIAMSQTPGQINAMCEGRKSAPAPEKQPVYSGPTRNERMHAARIDAEIRVRLLGMGIDTESDSVFVTSPVLTSWIGTNLHRGEYPGHIMVYIRHLAKLGILRYLCGRIHRWPHNGVKRYSGAFCGRGKVGKGKDVRVINNKDEV